MSDVILKLEPSLGRRLFGAILLSLIGACLIYTAFFGFYSSRLSNGVILVTGVLCLAQVFWNLCVAQNGLVLTTEGLYDNRGELLCRISNMIEIDKGWFSFKPSNGFLIHLYEPEEKKWAPGLYWRIGKRLGIGGAIHKNQSKILAAELDLLIRERAMGPDL